MKVRALLAAAAAVVVLVVAAPASAATFTGQQRTVLYGIARDTWRFYGSDVDPSTHLPLDNLGPGAVRGAYTSASNVGVYLWAVVAAHDLGLISEARADQLAGATLGEVARLKRYDGFLYQWYDTNNGDVLKNPGDVDCNETTPAQDNCWFISAVDNGWYATGLIEVRQALPDLRGLADSLLKPMDFSIFYDNRPQTDCNVNASLGGQPTGQMYGGYYVDQGPAGYHNGALYSDPRIAMYVGMGRHQMPGDVWWRTWRTDPPARCATDPAPAFDPGAGYWHTYTDPQSGKRFPVWEGHYTYPGTSLTFVPTFAGGMFEGLMANLVVPETTWGTAQLRPRRSALGAGPGALRDRRPRLSRLGDVAVEHGRRHRRLRRVRRSGPGVRDGLAAGVVHERMRHGAREHRVPARLGDRATGAAAGGVVQPRDAADALPGDLHLRWRASTTRSTRRPAPSATAAWCSTSR